MKVVSCVAILTALIMLVLPARVQAEHSFEAGLGLPRGYMDVSANSFLNLTLATTGHFRWQSVLSESFAAKKSDGDWLALNVLAGYALIRYDLNKVRTGFAPFVAAGGGLHYMMSFAPRSGPLHDDLELKLLAKLHGFVGVEYSLGDRKLLVLKARLTYPSDIILDAFYLNYGIRF